MVGSHHGIVGKHAGDGASAYFLVDDLGSASRAADAAIRTAHGIHERSEAVFGDGLVEKVMIPALVAPVLAMVAAGIAILVAYRIVGRQHPGVVSRGFRLGQIVSGGLFSLAHGTNDAQKTMGIIFLALIANGNVSASDDVPTWVIVSAATAIALGTYVGGWRIIRTMGSRIIKMDTAQGFSAQGAGAAVILASSHYGFPLSTTQVISGGVMGAGAGKRLSAVRWGVAGNIVGAWLLTFPAAAGIGALTYGVTDRLDVGFVVPIVQAEFRGESNAQMLPFGGTEAAHYFAGETDAPILSARRQSMARPGRSSIPTSGRSLDRTETNEAVEDEVALDADEAPHVRLFARPRRAGGCGGVVERRRHPRCRRPP